jgi:hypothetical protein
MTWKAKPNGCEEASEMDVKALQTVIRKLNKSINLFNIDPADSDYQRGYLAALKETREEIRVTAAFLFVPLFAGSFYIPCNRPATRIIKTSDTTPYRMCDMCAEHNVTNRGAIDLGPFEGREL